MQEGSSSSNSSSGRKSAFLLAIMLFSVFGVLLVLQGDADFLEPLVTLRVFSVQ